MAKETVTKSSRFYCISLIPDFCKTPVGPATPPLPYTIKGEFKETSKESKNVKSHSEPVFLHDKSFIPSVTGDEPGVAKGIKSNTVGKRVESMTFSTTYGSNGTKTTQEGRIVWMNDRNTIGQIYERGGQGPKPKHADYTSKFEAAFNETGAKVKSGLSALSGEINQKTKEVGHALTEAGHDLLNQLSNKIDETRVALQPLARKYKNEISDSMHQFGRDAMDTGGKVATVSGGVALAGVGVAATGVGAPVAAVMEAGAAAGGTVGGTVAAVGAGAESGATMLDKAADYILTGKKPDLAGAAMEIGQNLAEGYIMRKLGPLLGKILPKKVKPKPGKEQPKKPPEPVKPKPEPAANRKGVDGGKEKPGKREKKDKPKDECPKTCATPFKSASADKPVHYGTGEEILYQTDFTLGGALPLAWARCYRSGSEIEDWSVLGARWACEFTESLSVCKKGMVFIDATGRAVRLPLLDIGEQFDHKGDGFIITRVSDDEFALTWLDGQHHILQRGPNGWLPHGFDGVNMMLKPQAPLAVRRYHLVRNQARDARGYTVERMHQAAPGQVLLRIRNDDGRVLEALRAPSLDAGLDQTPRIGQIDEVRSDGSRICHVRYDYALENAPDAFPPPDYFEAPEPGFVTLPVRANLVRQRDCLDNTRGYHYRHHLLTRYSNYGGFAFELDWISLAALRERWQGSDLPLAELTGHFPLYLCNSYQARATATRCADGSWPYLIDYLDMDTTLVTEPDGARFEFHFNDQWLVTRLLQYLPGQTSPVTTGKRRWSKDGLLLEDIDAELRSNRYEYDGAGNLISHTDANGQITRTEYNAANLPTCIIDAMGHSTRLEYDTAGRVTRHTDALNQTTQYEYDAQGRLIAVIDAKGGRSQLGYDAAGNLQSHTDCSGFVTRYEYDANGNLTAQINAIGQATTYRYDILNRLQRIQYPDNSSEQLEYDPDDNLLCHIDAKGQATRYRYNGQGQPVSRMDANGTEMHYRYDPALRLSELINGNGESYRFAYHPQGWLASETGFDGKTTKYEYDAAGRLKSSDNAGQKTEFLRDGVGQLLARMNADGVVRFAYDPLGHLIAVSSPSAENHFKFDPIGQLIEERSRVQIAAQSKRPLPTPLHYEAPATELAFNVSHQYDALGNRIQTFLPNGRKLDTLRYGSGHWHGTLWQGQSVVDLERDSLHRESSRSIGKGLQAFRSYDAQSRLERFSFRRGDRQVQQREYSYDQTGNLTGIQDNRRGYLHYEYDPLGQLLRAAQPGLSETFKFDPAGNLLDPGVVDRPLQNQPSPDSAEAKLAKVTHNLLQGWLGMVYEYDVQGNTVLKRPMPGIRGIEQAELSYEYDADNRIRSACKKWPHKQNFAEYYYDAFNRRIAKRVMAEIFDPTQTKVAQRQITTTFFVWDGDTLLQEIEEGKTTTYLYEPDSFVPLARIESQEEEEIYARGTVYLSHIGDWDLPSVKNSANAHVIAWENWQGEHTHAFLRAQRAQEAEQNAARDQRLFYQCDHLGTPLELFDADGNTAWAAKYKAWGGVFELDAEQVKQPLRFQGQYFDAETGLHYNRHRYYDPETARFITQDPIGLAGGVNTYQYVVSPIAWTDPLGLSAAKLAINLRNAQRPVQPGQTPHHLVQENCNKNKHVQGSREILARNGIGIDDAPNGARVWGTNPSQESKGLHPGKNAANAAGNRHSGPHIHSDLNDKLIYQTLRNAEKRGANLENVMNDLGRRIENGSWKKTFACCC
jgi:RHS repeat-associated protein